MSASLSIVARGHTSEAPVNDVGERVRQLQVEAKRLAREHVEALEAGLLQIQQLALEIANGGEAYPPGVRDIARRLGDDSAARVQTLEVILARHR
jgi:hypothetical protein